MWLCILTGRWFEETFENAQRSKMLLCILTSRRFEEAFENTVEKSQTNVTSAIMPLFEKAICGHIWKRTVVKSWTNAINALIQCDYASSRADVLRTLLKAHNGEKSNKCNQCDFAPSLRTRLKTHSGGCRRFEEAENTQWRKVKQMQPVLLWIISCRQFKETLENVWIILRWRKRVQLMWLWIITGTQFLKTFEETKQVCADRLTDIHILGQSDTKLVWGSDSNYWEIMNESI